MPARPSFPLPEGVALVDVGLRDGLQSLATFVPTEVKVEIAELLIASGFTEIEVVSFAHPKVLPQLADAADVIRAVRGYEGVVWRGLVPNVEGARRAVESGVDEMTFVIPCDDDLSVANQNRTVDQLLAELGEIADLGRASEVAVSLGLGIAFFTPGKGVTPPARVVEIASRALDNGIDKLYLASSAGMAEPRQVFDLVGEVRSLGVQRVGLHLHNRNGLALANALAGLQAGVDWLEGAFCGLGGDPWLLDGDPRQLGNVPMEDLVHLMSLLGVGTGIAIDRYFDACRRIEVLLGIASTSFALHGGRRGDLATR